VKWKAKLCKTEVEREIHARSPSNTDT